MAKLNMKRLTAAFTNRGLGSAVGGAVNVLSDKVLPQTMKPILKTAIKAGVGAIAPEFAPKMKMADYAGAGLVGATVSDFMREQFPALSSGSGTSGIGEDLDRGYVMEEDTITGSGDNDSPIANVEDSNDVVLE